MLFQKLYLSVDRWQGGEVLIQLDPLDTDSLYHRTSSTHAQ